MRIPQNHIHDRVAWLHTKDGQYYVKSSYHYWFERHHNQDEQSGSQGWGRLWKLQIPHKMKFFWWRVCRSNLPVRYMLRGKGVNTSIICPMCNADVEHFRHVFLECPWCWSYTGGEYDISNVEHLFTWVLERLSSETSLNLVRIASTLWGIWFARNMKIWEEKQLCLNVAMEIAIKMIDYWKKAQQGTQTTSSTKQSTRVKWKRPQVGWQEVNVDASIF